MTTMQSAAREDIEPSAAVQRIFDGAMAQFAVLQEEWLQTSREILGVPQPSAVAIADPESLVALAA